MSRLFSVVQILNLIICLTMVKNIMVAILEMATMGRHFGFSKLQSQYSVLELSKTYESVISIILVFALQKTVAILKNGGHLENSALMSGHPF